MVTSRSAIMRHSASALIIASPNVAMENPHCCGCTTSLRHRVAWSRHIPRVQNFWRFSIASMTGIIKSISSSSISLYLLSLTCTTWTPRLQGLSFLVWSWETFDFPSILFPAVPLFKLVQLLLNHRNLGGGLGTGALPVDHLSRELAGHLPWHFFYTLQSRYATVFCHLQI